MKLTLSPTDTIVTAENNDARIWRGRSDKGVTVSAAIQWVKPETHHVDALADFDQHLREIAAPAVMLPYTRLPRGLHLACAIGAASSVHADDALRILEVLATRDDVLAELMAVVARPGPAPSYNGFEFLPESPEYRTRAMWMFSGDGFGDLHPTHHLPEPGDPTET